ncbi:MAG: heavy metal translocating P-type ATPase metal-binding domain-containing protein [Polyangiales bacterium]
MTQSARANNEAAPDCDRPFVASCTHCAQPLLHQKYAPFCCRGCQTVHGILSRAGLTRYYEIRRGPGLPPADGDTIPGDHKWLEVLESERAAGSDAQSIQLDIQGVHCAACVWLVEELFRRQGGSRAGRMSINPALGRIELQVARDFPLTAWVESVEELGYVLGTANAGVERRGSDDLLIRMGICAALAANTMLFAAAIYVGLREGPLYVLINQLSYAAGVLSVLIGGSVFIRSAMSALRNRVLHLDVPIALGILLAFGGSTWSFFGGSGHAAYVDTLTVFVALMLVGRWLQQRMIERNRSQLLADDGIEGLLTRRIQDGVVQIVHCIGIEKGDHLLVAHGDLVPVDATLTHARASCSLDWIDGESRPREFLEGDVIPAGAFNVGGHAFSATAASEFSASAVVGLLGTQRAQSTGPIATRWWSLVARYYVVGVIILASSAIAWWSWTEGTLRAIEVGTAVLVVTCPCAFGIAAPLAYELVLNRLRRAGIFVRAGDLLDRIRATRRIVFDKTGTLTTGTLAVEDPDALRALSDSDVSLLYNLAARSAHPKSVAIRQAVEGHPAARVVDLEVSELPGLGVSTTREGSEVRLGAPGWCHAPNAGGVADVVFTSNGEVRAAIRTTEQLRPDAKTEIARLSDNGYELAILSGDAPIRVKAMAASLGLSQEAAIGGQTPQDKAVYVETHDPARTLLVGDGLNDRVAMEVAACSGTPAVNRPFMASRCDFYFISPGLKPIAQILRSSDELAQVVRRLLTFAVAYNAITVSIAMAGLMQPWLAAVLMPLSSLATLAYAMAALAGEGRAWRS